MLVVSAAGALLSGCGLARMDAEPSKPVDMSGSWVLDRAASDDPKPLLDKLRPKPTGRRWGDMPDDGTGDDSGPGGQQGGQQGPPGGGGGPGGGRGGRGRGGGGDQGPPVTYRNGADAFTHQSVLKMLLADLARADNMSIRQSDSQFSIDYGSSVRSFTPGSKSVVSASWGVADQSSGWKGRDFIILVKPQQGVASSETYTLIEDGKRLVEELKLGGGDFPSVKLKRIYNHSNQPLNRAVPIND